MSLFSKFVINQNSNLFDGCEQMRLSYLSQSYYFLNTAAEVNRLRVKLTLPARRYQHCALYYNKISNLSFITKNKTYEN